MNVPVKKVDGALPSNCTGLMAYCDGPTKAYYYSKGTAWSSDTNSKGTEGYILYGAHSGGNYCGVVGQNVSTSFNALTRIGNTEDQWTQISSGINHSLALKKDGSLWGWGCACSGQIGNGTSGPGASVLAPSRESLQSNEWCHISAGARVSAAIKIDGSLWTWGDSSCGNLGNGTAFSCSSTPTREFTSSNNWCVVSVGACHSIAIKKDGSLWGWGNNTCGEIGDGSGITKITPSREVTSSNDWCAAAAGSFTSHAIKKNGTLWSWGSGVCGALGDGAALQRSTPVQEVSLSTNWSSLSATYAPSVHAIKKDGSLWSWGYNLTGQLATNNTIGYSSPVREITSSNNWSKVVGGWTSVFGLKQDGTLWGWGVNSCGQLLTGQKYYTSYSSPVQEYTKSNNWVDMAMGRGSFVTGHAIKKVVQGYCV